MYPAEPPLDTSKGCCHTLKVWHLSVSKYRQSPAAMKARDGHNIMLGYVVVEPVAVPAFRAGKAFITSIP